MTDSKATLALCLAAALLSSIALHGLASGAGSTLSALERIPVHRSDLDESPEARRERLRDIAEAIDGASANLDDRAWLIMTARRESGLAVYVTNDEPRCSEGRGGVCDGGRAFGLWQLHGTSRDLTLLEQAREAIQRFRRAANYCHSRGVDYWPGGVSQYATGRPFDRGGCSWPEAVERVREMRRIRGML